MNNNSVVRDSDPHYIENQNKNKIVIILGWREEKLKKKLKKPDSVSVAHTNQKNVAKEIERSNGNANTRLL